MLQRPHPAVANLALAILRTSYNCGQQLKEIIDEKFGKGSAEAEVSWLAVQYEFLFFFAHLSLRYLFSKSTEDKVSGLQNLLGPFLADATTDTWFENWPAQFKSKIRSNFYEDMNLAEIKYSKYRKLYPEKDEDLEGTLFWELGKNIAPLTGWEHNPEVVFQSVEISMKEFNDMKLNQLIDAVDKEI